MINLLAKRNYVLPFLSQYGKYLKTHRLARQYLWAAIIPSATAYCMTQWLFLNNTENLWSVHARRMNQKYNIFY